MASVTITIPDALIPRIRAAARGQFPQYAALGDAALFRQVTADQWRDILATHEGVAAADAAIPGWRTAHQVAADQARADAAGIA